MIQFRLHPDPKISKVQQIVKAVVRQIDKGGLRKDAQLPSINIFSGQYGVARDTVEKAYRELKRNGYIHSVVSKGYFVADIREKNRLKVLLIFNKLSSYKRIVYESFLETLDRGAKVDLQLHHYDPKILREIIENNLGKYHYYVVMPHFFANAGQKECLSILNMIPENELVLLDKRMNGHKKQCIEVYQNFEQDIYEALCSATDLLLKYGRIELVLEADSHHPPEITKGATKYGAENNMKVATVGKAESIKLTRGTVYIVTSESQLAIVLKKIKISGMQQGRDVGIISFNETVLKEVLDITVITTDFEAMGRSAARCILDNQVKQVKNPFYMIRRNSL